MTESENTSAGQLLHHSQSLTSLTLFLKTMLWVSLVCSVLSLISDVMQLNLISSGAFSQGDADSNDTRQQIAGMMYLGAFIVTGITFLKWIHRANANCHRFGAEGMAFSAGWSIGYYFIPILNLYKPYRAMKEIWQVSTNPTNWQKEVASPMLNGWWALWLISGFIGQISLRLSMRADTVSALQISTTVSIISAVVDIPLNIVAIFLISAICVKQEKLAEKLLVTGTIGV